MKLPHTKIIGRIWTTISQVWFPVYPPAKTLTKTNKDTLFSSQREASFWDKTVGQKMIISL